MVNITINAHSKLNIAPFFNSNVLYQQITISIYIAAFLMVYRNTNQI